jgi:hypothetical protein
MFTLSWLLVIPLVIADQIVMTVIVRREYLGHRPLWEGDGKPRWIFWIPKESMLWGWFVTYSGAHAFRRLTWDWLISMPAWIAKDRHTRRLLSAHRILFPAFWICILLALATAFLSWPTR